MDRPHCCSVRREEGGGRREEGGGRRRRKIGRGRGGVEGGGEGWDAHVLRFFPPSVSFFENFEMD